jgi:hypothetical protein
MNTLTIPINLISEKNLMVIPRLQYEKILSYLKITDEHENIWMNAAKDKFLKSYNKTDSIYDQI